MALIRDEAFADLAALFGADRMFCRLGSSDASRPVVAAASL
jgi:hypothetical protein